MLVFLSTQSLMLSFEIFPLIASLLNCLFTKLITFSIGLRSGLPRGMLTELHQPIFAIDIGPALESWKGSQSSIKTFPDRLLLPLKLSRKLSSQI